MYDSNSSITIGSRLKQLRHELNLSQNEVANLCFVARSSYAQYENNAVYPPQSVQITLTKLYKVSLDYLNGLTDIRKQDIGVVCENPVINNFKIVPIINPNTLEVLNRIPAPLDKVTKGSFCYMYSPARFPDYRIKKNDLLLLRRLKKFSTGDILVIRFKDETFIGKVFITEKSFILYNSILNNGFIEIPIDDSLPIGQVKEVTFSI
ncbi:helix-turn-helix domain-containing protein [Clostridium sulfidigenes]|uniref:helix-turn-helix domain-containing protein n=1 Tax=Clostridium sulfidigenes TaxID=318464 RepID=UPI003F88D2D3